MKTRATPTAILSVILLVVMAVAFLATHGPLARDSVPTERQWNSDVADAMEGSKAYVARQVEDTPGQLAVNLDIDNTSLASYYRPGRPVEDVLAFALYAKSKGVAVLFSSGRRGPALERAAAALTKAGFPIDQLCGRTGKETLAQTKQRCRAHFKKLGYRLIANVGNRPTDFVGGGAGRTFRLPNYDGTLA